MSVTWLTQLTEWLNWRAFTLRRCNNDDCTDFMFTPWCYLTRLRPYENYNNNNPVLTKPRSGKVVHKIIKNRPISTRVSRPCLLTSLSHFHLSHFIHTFALSHFRSLQHAVDSSSVIIRQTTVNFQRIYLTVLITNLRIFHTAANTARN